MEKKYIQGKADLTEANDKLYEIFVDIMDLADYNKLEQNEIGGGYKEYRNIYLQALYDSGCDKSEIDEAFNKWDEYMERYETEYGSGYDIDYIIDLVETYKFGKMRDKDLIDELKSYLF